MCAVCLKKSTTGLWTKNSTVRQKGTVFLRMLLLLLCNNSVEARCFLCIAQKISLVNKSDTLIWVNMFLMVLISLNKALPVLVFTEKKRKKEIETAPRITGKYLHQNPQEGVLGPGLFVNVRAK